MRLCKATSQTGHRCRNIARGAAEYCTKHAEQTDGDALLATSIGAIAGSLLAPGIGTVAGGLVGHEIWKSLTRPAKRKTRVFLSFDFDNDRGLRDLVLGQAKHPKARFEIVNRSLMEAAPEPTWQGEARAAIKNSDIVVVLLGKHTHRAAGVLSEVQMARECGVPLAQMIGYRNGRFKRVPYAGRLYAWTAENLVTLFE